MVHEQTGASHLKDARLRLSLPVTHARTPRAVHCGNQLWWQASNLNDHLSVGHTHLFRQQARCATTRPRHRVKVDVVSDSCSTYGVTSQGPGR